MPTSRSRLQKKPPSAATGALYRTSGPDSRIPPTPRNNRASTEHTFTHMAEWERVFPRLSLSNPSPSRIHEMDHSGRQGQRNNHEYIRICEEEVDAITQAPETPRPCAQSSTTLAVSIPQEASNKAAKATKKGTHRGKARDFPRRVASRILRVIRKPSGPEDGRKCAPKDVSEALSDPILRIVVTESVKASPARTLPLSRTPSITSSVASREAARPNIVDFNDPSWDLAAVVDEPVTDPYSPHGSSPRRSTSTDTKTSPVPAPEQRRSPPLDSLPTSNPSSRPNKTSKDIFPSTAPKGKGKTHRAPGPFHTNHEHQAFGSRT